VIWLCLYDRHITKEEVEIAMKEHGMGDEANAKDLISEFDKNNVNGPLYIPLVSLIFRGLTINWY